MELRQKLELKRVMAAQMQQSLKVLTLPLPELKDMVSQELENNPTLEETRPQETIIVKVNPRVEKTTDPLSTFDADDGYYYGQSKYVAKDSLINTDLQATLISKEMNLQEILLRQLGIFSTSEEEFKVGQEIIGNIDENGYLKAKLEEIASSLNLAVEKVQNTLYLIQQFEPHGVGARSISECLLIQINMSKEPDPLLEKIIENHLEDVAKKRFNVIAKSLGIPLETVEPLVKKILQLDPKPGRNYSAEQPQYIIPDIIIEPEADELKITINNEYMPTLRINKTYRNMLKNPDLDQKTREFLTLKLRSAIELLRAISRRHSTLRNIVESIVEIQNEAIKTDLSCLKPLTFKDIAAKLNVHETTVCRAIMNKYAKIPCGIVALKDFFASHIHDKNGETISSTAIKHLIKDLIQQENRKKPLSDQAITKVLNEERKLDISRRTIAKYREELKIPASSFRKID
ncbi:MAG: RNA polymerase factor sigma-54 [Candidatus Omnitrophota bacterium]